MTNFSFSASFYCSQTNQFFALDNLISIRAPDAANPNVTQTRSITAGDPFSITAEFVLTNQSSTDPGSADVVSYVVPTSTPEPASFALLGAGWVGLGVARRGRG